MAKSKKIKSDTVVPLADRVEAETTMQKIAALQQEVKRRETEATDQINAIKTQAQQDIEPINEEIEGLLTFKVVSIRPSPLG